MLSNNRSFMVDHIVEELKNIHDYQPTNSFNAQSILLGGVAGKFTVRANVWLPRRMLHGTNADGGRPQFSFEQARDHNYVGRGYQTEIWKHNGRCNGDPGERVDLSFLERTTLPEHKVMLYTVSKTYMSSCRRTTTSRSRSISRCRRYQAASNICSTSTGALSPGRSWPTPSVNLWPVTSAESPIALAGPSACVHLRGRAYQEAFGRCEGEGSEVGQSERCSCASVAGKPATLKQWQGSRKGGTARLRRRWLRSESALACASGFAEPSS